MEDLVLDSVVGLDEVVEQAEFGLVVESTEDQEDGGSVDACVGPEGRADEGGQGGDHEREDDVAHMGEVLGGIEDLRERCGHLVGSLAVEGLGEEWDDDLEEGVDEHVDKDGEFVHVGCLIGFDGFKEVCGWKEEEVEACWRAEDGFDADLKNQANGSCAESYSGGK